MLIVTLLTLTNAMFTQFRAKHLLQLNLMWCSVFHVLPASIAFPLGVLLYLGVSHDFALTIAS